MNKSRSARLQLCDISHLRRAWRALSKRKRDSHGLDGVTIEEFGNHLETHLEHISDQLRNKTYKFSDARGVLLPKPGSDKRRPIKIPAIRDRVVLKAISLLIEPRFRKYNLDCSFGYVRGRGVQDAIRRVKKLASEGKQSVLEADIHKFFDEVDRELLIRRFTREIKLISLRKLIENGLRMELGNLGSFTDEERKIFPAADSGIPQGGVLSPMLANFYLYPLDKAMQDGCFDLVRYADDFVVMCDTQQKAKQAYDLAKSILEDELRLRLHPLGAPNSKTRILQFNKGLKFLGVQFAGGKIAPSESIVNKFKERVRTILDARQGKSLLKTLTSLANTIEGWGQCYQEFDVDKIYADLDAHIRSELSTYMQKLRFLRSGAILSNRQLRTLGVPQLAKFKAARHAKVLSTAAGKV